MVGTRHVSLPQDMLNLLWPGLCPNSIMKLRAPPRPPSWTCRGYFFAKGPSEAKKREKEGRKRLRKWRRGDWPPKEKKRGTERVTRRRSLITYECKRVDVERVSIIRCLELHVGK